MRRWLRWVMVLLLLGLTACSSLPRHTDIPLVAAPHKMYFIYRGWHTSLLLDAQLLAEQSPALAPALKGQQYARIGWGDGDYFTGRNKSSATAAKALIASGYSAVQLLTYDYAPWQEIPAETRVALMISDQGLRQLTAYINRSLAVNAQGQLHSLPAFGDAQGYFYQSTHHYSLFNNCNSWSGGALREAGLPVASRLTAQGVFEQAKWVSQRQAELGLIKP